MKMNITHIMALSGVLLFAACNDFLDELPDNRTDVDTPEKVAKILVSAYASSLPITMHELMSDNVGDAGSSIEVGDDVFAESYRLRDITSQGTDSPTSVWQSNYSAIASANQALQAIEELTRTGNSTDMSAHKGEALLCRAYGHFVLVNTFCKAYNPMTSTTDLGVPYSEEVETTAINTYERGTVAYTYERINADIEAGLPLINNARYGQESYHFNKRAAYAFAAQFNLYYGQYQKAVDYATVAIGEDPSPLFRNYSQWGAYTSFEEYTAAWVRSDEAANFLIQPLHSLAGIYYYYRFVLTSALLNETVNSTGPWSGNLIFPDYTLVSSSRSYLFPKQCYYFEYTDKVASIGFYHAVPVPFTVEKTIIDRAEANALLGKHSEAARDLSYFYVGSGASAGAALSAINYFYSSYTYNKALNPRFELVAGTQKNLINACLHARRIITLHEGTRLLDIKRYGIAYEHEIQNGTNIQIEAWDNRLAIQLPELVIASGMTPNPR